MTCLRLILHKYSGEMSTKSEVLVVDGVTTSVAGSDMTVRLNPALSVFTMLTAVQVYRLASTSPELQICNTDFTNATPLLFVCVSSSSVRELLSNDYSDIHLCTRKYCL